MHCCWEGITSQMMNLWTNSIYHKELWYIGSPNKLQALSTKCKQIQVPHNHRNPISIDFKNIWKGINYQF
jgi:hypothetical protein